MHSTSRPRYGAILPLATAFALLPAAVAAQGASGGDLAEIINVTVRDGHGYEFEEGVKRHMDVTGEMGNPSAWFVWEVMTGENTGSYLVGTFGHSWADFDQRPDDPQKGEMSFRNNIQPHVAEAQASFWRLREDLSRSVPTEGLPTAFIQVHHYLPRYGEAQTVESAMSRVKEAASAAAWPGGDWQVYELVNGGQHPHFVVVIPGESFADFAEPSPSMYEMVVDQLGEDEANALFQSFSGAIATQMSEMLAFRRDLSYVPGEGM